MTLLGGNTVGCESVRLMQGDCLELLKDIPDGSIDLILTDPPYGWGTTDCKWDSVIPFEPMWTELKRIIKPNGAIVLFGSEPFSSHLRLSNLKMFKYDWVWEKEQGVNPLLSKKQPMNNIEYIHVFYAKQVNYNPQFEKGQPYSITRDKTDRICEVNGHNFTQTTTNNDGYRYPKRVLKFNRQTGLHPTQKPVTLLEYLIKTYTNENETVLDFTAGSMSTAIACINTNRKGIMIEKDAHYVKVGSDRVAQALRERGNNNIWFNACFYLVDYLVFKSILEND